MKIDRIFTSKREPFYEMARKYIKDESVIVDIGAGEGGFAKYLDLKNVIELDIDREEPYVAPNRLPFEDSYVDFIHCCQMIEHLNLDDGIKFVKELDRVLKVGGYMMFSTPFLSMRFFDHPYHRHVYVPKFFISCLTGKKFFGEGTVISRDYRIKELSFQYRINWEREWYSIYSIIDFFLLITWKTLLKIGFRKYHKHSYTIILKKQS